LVSAKFSKAVLPFAPLQVITTLPPCMSFKKAGVQSSKGPCANAIFVAKQKHNKTIFFIENYFDYL
jgi:hypothetical protein